MTRVVRATTTPITLSPRDKDTLVVAAVADLVVNLPRARRDTRGNKVRIYVETLSSGVGALLRPNAVDAIQGDGITTADDKDIINTAATDELGDGIAVECDGETGWVITNLIGTWAREA